MTQADALPGLDARDARLVARLHGNLPLTDHPFAAVGAEIGMGEDEVIERLQRLLSQGVLTRFGPLFQIERAGGRFVLAALEVPADRFDAVAALVNSLPEVAHNYRRDHPFNMWFVVGAESPAQIDAVLARVTELTGLPVHAFPKEREYFVELRLPIPGAPGGADGTR
jgi:siroheme decarboxylase